MANLVHSVKSFVSNITNAWRGAFYAGGVQIPSDPNISFFCYDGELQWTGCENISELRSVFRLCAPVSATINAKADAFSTGVFEIINSNTGNFLRGQKAAKWMELFENPNPLQSKKQFLRQIYVFTQVFGGCLIYKNYAVGFPDIPYSMWILPPYCIHIDEIEKPLYQVKKDDILNRVSFLFNGYKTPIKAENLMLIIDSAASTSEKTLFPISRLANMVQPVSTLLSAVEAELTMIQRKGALGILSNRAQDQSGSIPLKKGEKDELQTEFRGYGLTRNQKQVIITSANLSWQSMTYPVRELMLHESYIKSYKDVCAGYGYPFTLVPHSDQATYNNIKTDSLRLYQNTIVPEADDLAEQLMSGLNTKEDSVILAFNYSKNPVFQQTEKERGEGMRSLNQALEIEWKAGKITLNDWNIALEKDIVDREEFNMYKPEYDRWIAQNVGAQYIPNSSSQSVNTDLNNASNTDSSNASNTESNGTENT